MRARVEAAAPRSRGRSRSRSPSRSARRRRSCTRSRASTASSIEEQGELYGENPRTKIERCLAVTDAEAEAARAARREYERRATEALEGVDLLLTPTLMFVAPPADIDELAWRERDRPLHVSVQPARLARARAAVRRGRGRAAGVGAARRAAGRGRLVLAAGLALEEALRGEPRRDLAFAHRARRRRGRDHAGALPRERPRGRDEARPDTGLGGRPRRGGGDPRARRARAAGRGRPRRGVRRRRRGARWIVDPIDGTKNYVRGIPVWGTLLALERDGVVEVGLVSAPALGRRWWAVRGEGAWASRRRAVPRVGGRADRGLRRVDDRRRARCRRAGRRSSGAPGRSAA